MTSKSVFFLFFGLVFIFSCSEPKNQLPLEVVNTDSILTESIEPAMAPERYQAIYDSINAETKIPLLREAIKRQFAYRELNGGILIEQAGIELIKSFHGNTCLRCDDQHEIDENTLFQLASLSKTFTAVAIMKLVENKQLSLTDSVQRFYPEFPYPGVTIEQLLSHRSGLPNYLYSFEDSARTAQKPNNQTLMEWFAIAQPEKYRKKGKGFSYNNSNYAVLGAIIEKASQLSFEDYLSQVIFEPLGMNHTYVINHIPEDRIVATGYERRRPIPKDFFDDVVGDKGIYSTASDLLKWYKGLTTNKILNPQNTELMFTPKSFEKPGTRNYGYGFRMRLDQNTQKVQTIYHNGWWKGFNTLFSFEPETESLIIILTNVRNKSVFKINEIYEVLRNQKDL